MRAPALALAATLAILLGACNGAAQSPSPVPDLTAAPTSAPTLAPSASPAFPTSITDDEGTTVALAAEPQKIVSLTPATTETLFALGAGPRLVGRTDSDDYPPEAASVQVVVKLGKVDVEQVVGLSPDLVLAGGDGFTPPDVVAQLRSLHIPVVVVYAKDTAGVFSDIRLIGQASGEADPANAMADAMASEFDAVKAVTAGAAHPRVFYEIDATSTIYTAADQSFLAQMIQDAGGEPVTTGSTTAYDIPLEQLVAANPAIILLGDAAYGTTADQVKGRSGWGTIAAVQTGAIYPVDDTVITRPGPRLVEGLLDLVRAIHPELNVPGESGAPLGSPAASPAAS
ncbi:MAG TPA: helical backbone metal receptor [Candidatus Limnocylindrales bacterium]